MEWVETTGKTLEEAREAALDQLGVDETDAEFEVLEQPKAGLFGRVRGEARVRARVRPTAPRAKEDRRDRRRRAKSGGTGGNGSATNGASTGHGGSAGTGGEGGGRQAPAQPSRGKGGTRSPVRVDSERPDRGEAETGGDASGGGSAGSSGAGSAGGAPRRRRRRSGAGSRAAAAANGPATDAGEADLSYPVSGAGAGGARGPKQRGSESSLETKERRDGTEVEVPLQEQGRVAEEFLAGLVTEFGLTAEVAVNQRDDENLDLALNGRDLGLLIGQKGATLLAIQDLTRTVVQHKTSATNGRIHVDVGGYRQKRSEALAKFANEVAAKVKQTGKRTALEPMSAADRKVVHDTITGIEGVATTSEGEEPRRRVVIFPAE